MPPSPAPRSSTAATPPTSKTSTPNTKAIRPRSMPNGGSSSPSLKDYADRRRQKRARRLLEETELAAAPGRRSGGRARRAMGGNRKAPRRENLRQGAGQGRRNLLDRRAAGHARFDPRADADPRLPHARPFPRQARSARHPGRTERGRARSALLRLYRSRHGPPHLPRQGARPRIRVDARDRRHPAPHLLPDARRGVHAHLQCRAKELDPGAHRRPRQGNQLHRSGQARHPQQAGGSGRLREIPRRQIHRHQALRPRRRRVADSGARADHQARRQSRREGDRASACRIAAGSTCSRK